MSTIEALNTNVNPIRLATALLISLVLGALFLLISVPHYYSLIFAVDSTTLFNSFLKPPNTELSSQAAIHPLLVGMLLGCTISVMLYNILRYLYTRYHSNLLFAVSLCFQLLFLLFITGVIPAQQVLYLSFNSATIYISIVLSTLFLHTLCLSCIPQLSRFKKPHKQLIRHMWLLCLGGISLLVLPAPYAHLLTYFLLISSAVILLGNTLYLLQKNYPPAQTLFIGLSIFFLTLIAIWPSFINESFLSADTAALFTLTGLLAGAIIISLGLSEAHRYQVDKNTNASRQSAAAEAESRAKSELLAKISHEIRTPLSGVLGMTTLLQDTPLSSKQRDYAQTIQGSGNELLSLINEILDISRLESNEIILSHTQFNLADLLQECTQAFSNNAHEQQVELTVFLQPQVPEILFGDPVRLRQALLSMLKNAFQRTHHGEIILSVTLEQPNKRAQLEFSLQDTGTQLSEEECYILNTAQLHSKDLLSTSFIGGNLGIIIARQLITLMDGFFNVQRSAQGTIFTFRIPFHPKQSQVSRMEADTVLRNKNILIIDSNALAQKALAQQCSEWGLLVNTCSSATDAVALLRNKTLQGQRFSAILISETLHKPSAIEFAVRIQEDPILTTDTRLIMLTSSSHIDHIAVRNAGISHVLMKPVSGSTLKTTLINAIQHNMTDTPAVKNTTTGKHILVAEDDAISVKVISGLLGKLNVSIDVAANGQIALDMLQKNNYDLVLMDCEMPVMDGFTAAQKRREYEVKHGLTPIPIIALSAHVLEAHQTRAKQSGMNGHLAKPIELAKLQALLART